MGPVLMAFFAYLLGSVPTGFLLGSLSGVDIRHVGSGNVGATNVARVVGVKQGIITLVIDVAKGFVPVFLSLRLGFSLSTTCLVAVAAFLGHLYSVFLRFQGGKGVATALGIFLALAPLATAVLVLIFSLVTVTARMISLASLVAAGLAPIIFWVFSYSPLLVGLSFFIALFIAVRHRQNIQRLIAGAEPRFSL
jgi:glycerol-3-phosphate acyltransferase PlsY